MGATKRAVVQWIGRTTAGREQLVCSVTAPENHWKLAYYQEISQQRARVEGLTDETALQRSRGKARQWFGLKVIGKPPKRWAHSNFLQGAQPHGAFKLPFSSIHYSTAEPWR